MLRLGHITYSNCLLPHAGILSNREKFPFVLVEGVPSELNRLLFEGRVDVSPSSSIEYAINSGRYILFPCISISSRRRAMSIILESRVPISALHGRMVALTSSSATSIVLLRILLEIWHEVVPKFTFFDQDVEDPGCNSDAILTIGDIALKRGRSSVYPHVYDLGELWHEFINLPFVFALWQINYKKNIDKELDVLYDILLSSKAYGLSNHRELAISNEERYGIPAPLLEEYWSMLSYDLGDAEIEGLLAFYEYAAKLKVIEKVPRLKFWKEGRSLEI